MLVVNTVVAQGPIIFVSMAQSFFSGEIDVWYEATNIDTSMADVTVSLYRWTGASMNYTEIVELYGNEYNLSPRFLDDAEIGTNDVVA